jgi:hypothetical protein
VAVAKEKERGSVPEKCEKADPSTAWDDGNMLVELVKNETDVEAESKRMDLDTLRLQNRAIEEYVMRLVRRRDELKKMTKLAEEQDSYLLLGLDGPEVTEGAVKKAYRDLARREHPDKAGTSNKQRFQAIQHAYTSILKQRREVGGPSILPDESPAVDKHCSCPAVAAALLHASRGRDAADRIADCAHRALCGARQARETNGQPKLRAFRVLREYTRKGGAELRDAAGQLRRLGEEICIVVRSAEQAMDEHEDWSTRGVAGIGLRDRTILVEDAANSCVSSAELLERICEATESTVQKVAAADSAPKARGSRGSNEAGPLVQLGVQLLGESLTRNSAVARRSADEAINGALKALELSRALQTLDLEPRAKETDEDAPMPAPDAEKSDDVETSNGTEGEDKYSKSETAEPSSQPQKQDAVLEPTSQGDNLKSAAQRVKERHVTLRVKNLRFASKLNEEALRAQARLRALLERSHGAMMPEVTVAQKCILFDLVLELLDSALVEVTRHARSFAVPPGRCLARAVVFILVLEHGGEIAVPTDSRTQVLKLAALVDSDLLCQVIDGPFCQQLLAAGGVRQRATFAAAVKSCGEARAKETAQSAGRAWDEAVRACCGRITGVIRKAMVGSGDCVGM